MVLVITTGMNIRAFVQHDCDGRYLRHPKFKVFDGSRGLTTTISVMCWVVSLAEMGLVRGWRVNLAVMASMAAEG